MCHEETWRFRVDSLSGENGPALIAGPSFVAARKKPEMKRSGPTLTTLALSAGLACQAGAAQGEHLVLQRNASAVGLHCTTFMRLLVLPVGFYLAVSGRLAGCCPSGERETYAASFGRCSGGGLAGRTCCCRWLWRLLRAILRMLCSVAVSGGI